MEKCSYCNGTGKKECFKCNGIGSQTILNAAYIPLFGYAMPETVTCPECKGNKRTQCTHCNGTGNQ